MTDPGSGRAAPHRGIIPKRRSCSASSHMGPEGLFFLGGKSGSFAARWLHRIRHLISSHLTDLFRSLPPDFRILLPHSDSGITGSRFPYAGITGSPSPHAGIAGAGFASPLPEHHVSPDNRPPMIATCPSMAIISPPAVFPPRKSKRNPVRARN